ncbi:hypothetical protein QQY66_04690 [Streptomyces sp. DG2A-72]|nr:hypothetical protein [Streptomyces sp. DG2A-72]MDO0931011.1 hypothetical protein [Streptomyces sp. DG2A-72]
MRRHEPDEFVDVLEGLAEFDRSGEPGFEDGEPFLGPAQSLRRKVGRLQALGEIAAPQLLGTSGQFTRLPQLARVPCRQGLDHQAASFAQVVSLCSGEQISGAGPRQLRPVSERAAQPGDVLLHQVAHMHRRRPAPHGLDQAVVRQGPPLLEQQDGEHRALLRWAERDLHAVAQRAQWAEQFAAQGG